MSFGTIITDTGDGVTTDYAVTFPYLDVADIKASLDGVPTTAFTVDTGTDTLTFDTAPGVGVAIEIRRETCRTTVPHTFTDKRQQRYTFRNPNLDENFRALLYCQQEQIDSGGGGGSGEANTTSNAGTGEGAALPKAGVNLPFKNHLAGPGVSVTTVGNDIVYRIDAPDTGCYAWCDGEWTEVELTPVPPCSAMYRYFTQTTGYRWIAQHTGDPPTNFVLGYDGGPGDVTPTVKHASASGPPKQLQPCTHMIPTTPTDFEGDCGFTNFLDIGSQPDARTPSLMGYPEDGETHFDEMMGIYASENIHIGYLARFNGTVSDVIRYQASMHQFGTRQSTGNTGRLRQDLDARINVVRTLDAIEIEPILSAGASNSLGLFGGYTIDDELAISMVITYFGAGTGARIVDGSTSHFGILPTAEGGEGQTRTLGMRLEVYINDTFITAGDVAVWELGAPTSAGDPWNITEEGVFDYSVYGKTWNGGTFDPTQTTPWASTGMVSFFRPFQDFFATVIQTGDQTAFQAAYATQAAG